jgi:hypothetical protein
MRNERAFRCVFPLRRERHRFGLDDAPNGLLNPSLRLSKSCEKRISVMQKLHSINSHVPWGEESGAGRAK